MCFLNLLKNFRKHRSDELNVTILPSIAFRRVGLFLHAIVRDITFTCLRSTRFNLCLNTCTWVFDVLAEVNGLAKKTVIYLLKSCTLVHSSELPWFYFLNYYIGSNATPINRQWIAHDTAAYYVSWSKSRVKETRRVSCVSVGRRRRT
jgi:hypothetical protein